MRNPFFPLDHDHGFEVPEHQEQPVTQQLVEQQQQQPLRKIPCRHPFWVKPCRCNPTAV